MRDVKFAADGAQTEVGEGVNTEKINEKMDTGVCGVGVTFIFRAVGCVEVVEAEGTTSAVGYWKTRGSRSQGAD